MIKNEHWINYNGIPRPNHIFHIQKVAVGWSVSLVTSRGLSESKGRA